MINTSFFNEFTLRLDRPAEAVVETLAERGILAGVPVSRLMPGVDGAMPLLLVAVTETASEDDMEAFEAGLREVLK